jgi:predicted lysophospholipase L1 biosynthesis ABC-type transport system permease subunit
MRRELADLRLAWRVALARDALGAARIPHLPRLHRARRRAIAVIGSLSAALERGIGNEGQRLLGGDIQFSVVHRELDEAELAFLEARGTVSTVATVRSMARSGDQPLLVEVKAVDDLYPLYGTFELEGGGSLAEALARTAAASASWSSR